MNSSLSLDWCSYKAARWACEQFHYSKTIPVGKAVHVGVWEDDRFKGVIIFTAGSGRATDGSRFGLRKHSDIAELQRVALTDHQTPVSRMIAIAVMLLRKQSPNLKMLVAYADPFHGHHGGIYQASGWTYIGKSRETVYYRDQDGRLYHPRTVSPSGVTVHFGKAHQNRVDFDTLETVKVPGKYTYVFPLDPTLQPVISEMAKPYPKRAKDSSEPSDSPVGRGGGSTDPHAPSISADSIRSQSCDNPQLC